MKSILISFVLLVLISCGKSGDSTVTETGTAITDNPNAALSDEVDKIHMDVMGKMDGIYSLKGKLEEKIANNPTLPEDALAEIRGTITQLDSANNVMMDFMHQPQPSDSTDTETAREFYETEIETIKKIRDFFDETLVKAQGVLDKK